MAFPYGTLAAVGLILFIVLFLTRRLRTELSLLRRTRLLANEAAQKREELLSRQTILIKKLTGVVNQQDQRLSQHVMQRDHLVRRNKQLEEQLQDVIFLNEMALERVSDILEQLRQRIHRSSGDSGLTPHQALRELVRSSELVKKCVDEILHFPRRAVLRVVPDADLDELRRHFEARLLEADPSMATRLADVKFARMMRELPPPPEEE